MGRGREVVTNKVTRRVLHFTLLRTGKFPTVKVVYLQLHHFVCHFQPNKFVTSDANSQWPKGNSNIAWSRGLFHRNAFSVTSNSRIFSTFSLYSLIAEVVSLGINDPVTALHLGLLGIPADRLALAVDLQSFRPQADPNLCHLPIYCLHCKGILNLAIHLEIEMDGCDDGLEEPKAEAGPP